MKDGDFVTIDYIARTKNDGNIFDLTKEDAAKKEGVYSEKVQYGPVTFIVGANFVIPGLDEALHGMNVGEKKTVEIPEEKAFGKRSEELVKLVQESYFKQHSIDAIPGSFINVNNIRGRIVSVSGGRVKVDFNHPLAGKTLVYEIEVKGTVTERLEKVKAIVSYFTGRKMSVKVDKDAEIETDMEMRRELKEIIASTISKWVGIGTVKFIDVFKSEKKDSKS
jgi:FKBP-type peptidyl-prolyl cis-trans isomerase SlyD